MSAPRSYSGTEPYVFVSYSHADRDVVYPELEWLDTNGIKVWYDEGITPGSRWSDALAQALSDCAYFVLYVTPNSAGSHHCLDELNYALEQDKPVLAIHLAETTLQGGIALRLGARQAVMQHELGEAVAHERTLAIVGNLATTPAPKTAPSQENDLERLCSSVMVMPFTTRDDTLLDLAEDLTDSVEDAISVCTGRMVTADETEVLRSKGMTVTAILDELNVGVAVEATLRTRGGKLQLNVELIDCRGSKFWRHRFSADVPETEDDENRLMNSMNWMVRRAITIHTSAEVQSATPETLGPWGLYTKAIEASGRIHGRGTARQLMNLAIEKRPGELLFRAELAAHIAGQIQTGFSRDIEKDSAEAQKLITDALPFTNTWLPLHRLAAAVGSLMDYDRSIVIARRAVEVAPAGDNLSAKWTLAFRLGFTTEGIDEALSIHEEIDKIDVPIRPMVHEKALFYICKGEVDAALEEAKAAVDGNSNPTQPYITLLVYANILAIKGRIDEAQEMVRRVRELLPEFRMERAIWSFARGHRDQSSKDWVTKGLQQLADLEG